MAEKSKTFTLSGGAKLTIQDGFSYAPCGIYLCSWHEKTPYYWFEVMEENREETYLLAHFAKDESREVLKKNRQDFIEWAGDAIWKKEVKNERS